MEGGGGGYLVLPWGPSNDLSKVTHQGVHPVIVVKHVPELKLLQGECMGFNHCQLHHRLHHRLYINNFINDFIIDFINNFIIEFISTTLAQYVLTNLAEEGHDLSDPLRSVTSPVVPQ